MSSSPSDLPDRKPTPSPLPQFNLSPRGQQVWTVLRAVLIFLPVAVLSTLPSAAIHLGLTTPERVGGGWRAALIGLGVDAVLFLVVGLLVRAAVPLPQRRTTWLVGVAVVAAWLAYRFSAAR